MCTDLQQLLSATLSLWWFHAETDAISKKTARQSDWRVMWQGLTNHREEGGTNIMLQYEKVSQLHILPAYDNHTPLSVVFLYNNCKCNASVHTSQRCGT